MLNESSVKNLLSNKVFGWVLLLIFLSIGMSHAVMRVVGWDFSSIPGDLGDSRFNMYILEHGYRFISGQISSFWDATYLFPSEKVIAYSDNLVGSMPFYAAFRFLGLDQHTSYQWWFILMFALNYLSCYFAFNKLFKSVLIANIAAYIFAFGLFNVGQIFHAQLFPRFALPLILYCFIYFLRNPDFKYLIITFALLVYQFLCGIYLGFFAFYGLLILSISHLIIFRKEIQPKAFLKSVKKSSWKTYLIFALAVVALMWLFVPYLEVAKQFGMRSFDAVQASIPRLRSYFFTSQASTYWYEIFFTHTSDKMEVWWSHFLFPGLSPYLVLLFGIPLIILKSGEKGMKNFYFFGLAMLLAVLMSMHFGGFTPYKLIYQLPGFSSMRAVNRIINVNVLFILLFVAAILQTYHHTKFRFVILSLLILIFVPIDNSFDMTHDVSRFDKRSSIEEIYKIKGQIENQYLPAKKAVAVKFPEGEMNHDQVIKHHIAVMLACQDLAIPCINGYSGNYPAGYMPFFDQVNQATLKKWLQNKDLKPEEVQMIHL